MIKVRKALIVYPLLVGSMIDGGMRPAKSSTQPRKAKTWCALKI